LWYTFLYEHVRVSGDALTMGAVHPHRKPL
jgi:hypothetical protein